MPPTPIHPALLERLSALAGDPGILEQAFARVRPRGRADLPDLIARIIELRRDAGRAPERHIPTRDTSAPPEWVFQLAGEPDPESRRAAPWPASERVSPLDRPLNPLLRLYIALAFRARMSFSLPRRRWPLMVHVLRALALLLLVWVVLSSTHPGIAILVLAVAGLWMLYATPQVGERVREAAAIADFNEALDRALEPPPAAT